jgi:hypothetical protein
MNSYNPPSESLLVLPITAFSARPKLTPISHENAASASGAERLRAHKLAVNDSVHFSVLQTLHPSTLITFSFLNSYVCLAILRIFLYGFYL